MSQGTQKVDEQVPGRPGHLRNLTAHGAPVLSVTLLSVTVLVHLDLVIGQTRKRPPAENGDARQEVNDRVPYLSYELDYREQDVVQEDNEWLHYLVEDFHRKGEGLGLHNQRQERIQPVPGDDRLAQAHETLASVPNCIDEPVHRLI